MTDEIDPNPTKRPASPEYIAKLLIKLTSFVPMYSLQMKKRDVLEAWVDDLQSYQCSVERFTEAFNKVRDGFRTYPSLAEFKEVLGVSMSDETQVEIITSQIVGHVATGSSLSITAVDLINFAGGLQNIGAVDLSQPSGRHTVKAWVHAHIFGVADRTPDRLRVRKQADTPLPEKARLELIKDQTTEIRRNVGQMLYRDDGELDHAEFADRVAKCRPAWMPDEWWLVVREQIVDASIPSWQNGRVTPQMMTELRQRIRKVRYGMAV